MEDNKTLIIWLKNGTICKFENVENFETGNSGIGFDYFGISTQVKRRAIFHHTNIAGYAIEI